MSLYLSFLFSCTSSSDSMHSVEVNGESRQFLLFEPESANSESLPVLINLHGFDGTARGHMEWADMRSLAEEYGFLLVYPQGADMDGSPHWNSSPLGGDNKSSTDDFSFFEELTESLIANHNGDSERVYVGGYSNGGFMSYSLACYHSETYAAIFAVSSTMTNGFEGDCAPTRPMPVLSVNGTSDYVVPYNGSEYYHSQTDIVNYWKTHNNITSDATVTDLSDRIQRTRYVGGSQGVGLDHYRIEGGDHVWFSDDFGGSDLNTIVWEFVSAFDQNGLRE